MKILAIIPARGGSKRIPRKNIKDFLGKPVIAYSIEAAQKSELFDEIMVSTDDQEIAEVAVSLGAVVPFMRSDANADDYATTLDVIKEVVSDYRVKFNREFDYVCCIYPTAPLIKFENILKGFKLISENELISVVPVVPFNYNIWRSVKIVADRTTMIWPEYTETRSQDLVKAYHDAGHWYWLNHNKITDSIFTDKTSSIILDEEDAQDIDDPIDWRIAEMKYKMRNIV